jgi:ATP-dependent Clp protease adaptor protein ClpS
VRLPGEAQAGVDGPLIPTRYGMADPAARAVATVASPATRPREKTARKTEGLPPYNVVLLDDNDHSYEYVIYMLGKVFGHPPEKAYELAREVDATGRVIVATTNLEKAELKRDQIHAFGPDPLIPRCKGSMSAVVEPASG